MAASATSIASILTQVRNQLVEPKANFWSDSELTAIMRLGALDLWGAILDLHQDHYFKVAGYGTNAEGPVLRANATEVSNIPPDCFRITLIEPRNTSSTGTGHAILFVPRKFNHPDFIIARTLDAQDPDSLPSRQLYYQITGVGSPVESPHILTAPLLNADLPLRIAYNPSIWPDGENVESNPVPGASDNALKAWTIAYARAKETDTRTPDAGWLGVYSTEKQLILTRLTPREEQEPEVVEDLFQGYGSLW